MRTDYYEEKGPKVIFGGNGKAHSYGFGTLTNGLTTFRRVGCVEELKYKLLSICRLCDKDHKVTFTKKKCEVKNKENQVILTILECLMLTSST